MIVPWLLMKGASSKLRCSQARMERCSSLCETHDSRRDFTAYTHTEFCLLQGCKILSIVKNKYDTFYKTEFQVFFFCCTRNDYDIILSFVCHACICWRANKLRVCIIILYVNPTCQHWIVKIREIFSDIGILAHRRWWLAICQYPRPPV